MGKLQNEWDYLLSYFYVENFLERNYYRLGNSSIIHTLLL